MGATPSSILYSGGNSFLKEYSLFCNFTLYTEQIFPKTAGYLYNVFQDFIPCKFHQLVNINEGLGLLKLADSTQC